jgi:gliding motility-associated-like protein
MAWIRRITLATLFLFSASLGAQTFDLVQAPNLSKCTGDSLRLTMTIGAPGMSATNDFFVLLAPGMKAAFTQAASDTLDIVKWQSITPAPTGTIADTISAGVKYAWVIIPPTITSNNFYGLSVRSTSPTLWSDTIQMTVNVAPEVSIDSIVGGFENLYSGAPDWGLCEGDTVVIYATKGLDSYQWTNGGSSINGATADSLIVFASGSYSVIGSSGNCEVTSLDTIINVYAPQTTITHIPTGMFTLNVLDKNSQVDSLAFCETESINLRGPTSFAPGTSVNYQWLKDSVDQFGQTLKVPINGATNRDFFSNESGLYSLVTYWFPGGCPDTSYSVELFVDTVPDTFIENIMWSWQSAASLDICPGDSTLLRPNATSFTNDWTYQWEVKYPISTGTWQALPGQDQEDLVVDTALMPGSAQYRLVINSENCDFTTAPLQVNVIPLPTVTVAPKDSLALCAGDSVLIGATGNGLSYQWTWATGAYSGVSFYAKDPGTYVVEATGPNNCLSYDTLKITQIVVTPNAGPDQVVMPGDVVQLNASGGLQYYWYADKPAYFSDPYNPQAQTRPTSDTTWYYVEVRSALGCWGIDSMMVVQFDPATLLPNLSHVMNVITPNGDGFNDVFDMSEVVQADSCDLVILDRWGAKVYEEARYISGWDGRNAGGDPLPDGTYYYLLLCNGEPRYRGAITVIRN